MSELTAGQYLLVYNAFSFTIAAMGAAFIFFTVGRSQVAPRYRPALLVSSMVVAIACYHYFRIFGSWEEAYKVTSTGSFVPSGKPFNDAYRYVDWLLTVPLLLVELVAVMQLGKGSTGMLFRLSFAAVLMILLGYPGEVIHDDMTMRTVWGLLSTIPFVYILYVLWGQLGTVLKTETTEVKDLVFWTRILIVATWGFYPITYLLPIFGLGGGNGSVVGVQLGYAIADVLAKAGYGVMIYNIARAKSEADGSLPEPAHA